MTARTKAYVQAAWVDSAVVGPDDAASTDDLWDSLVWVGGENAITGSQLVSGCASFSNAVAHSGSTSFSACVSHAAGASVLFADKVSHTGSAVFSACVSYAAGASVAFADKVAHTGSTLFTGQVWHTGSVLFAEQVTHSGSAHFDGQVLHSGSVSFTWPVVLGAAAASGTTFSATGRLTMAGTARVRKDIWLPPEVFITNDLLAQTANAGSMVTGSMGVDITGSIVGGGSTNRGGLTGSFATVTYLAPAVKQTASPVTAFAKFPVPRDRDTTGSINVWVEWTNSVGATATTGSKTCFWAGLAYFGSGSTVRTAGSCAACPTYDATAVNTWMSSSLGNLPSFNANDTWAVFFLNSRQDMVDDTLGSSAVRVAGVRLTYTACALGTASTE